MTIHLKNDSAHTSPARTYSNLIHETLNKKENKMLDSDQINGYEENSTDSTERLF